MSKNDHTDGEAALNGSHHVTGVTDEPAGECEQCGTMVTISEAKVETFPTGEGRVALIFCEECAL